MNAVLHSKDFWGSIEGDIDGLAEDFDEFDLEMPLTQWLAVNRHEIEGGTEVDDMVDGGFGG